MISFQWRKSVLVPIPKKQRCGLVDWWRRLGNYVGDTARDHPKTEGPQMKTSLRVLAELCREWAVGVNEEKSGVVHIRRRDIKTGGIFLQMMESL